MFDHLQIDDRRERWLVGCADAVLGIATAAGWRRSRLASPEPQRILVLRLERIGDLVMTLPALAALRTHAPGAQIDLVVGSWNEPLARLIREVDRYEILDAPWLARGDSADGWANLVRRARTWRRRAYDLAINFEPDIRSNLLMALSGAPRRVGFASRGGGALLTHAHEYDPSAHTTENARRLVAALPTRDALAHSREAGRVRDGRLGLPADACGRAAALLAGPDGARPARLVGIHASGGRPVKQWPPARFGEVAAHLAHTHGAVIVLTGAPSDRRMVDEVKAALPADVATRDLVGRVDLAELAATIAQLDLLVTGDTGPMHLADAVGTPVVAVFGPSDPARWGPRSASARVVRAGWWCSPCNRIRRPPRRCTAGTPDCLANVEVEAVCRAADEALQRTPLRT